MHEENGDRHQRIKCQNLASRKSASRGSAIAAAVEASEVIPATEVRTRVAQSRYRGEVQPQGRGLANASTSKKISTALEEPVKNWLAVEAYVGTNILVHSCWVAANGVKSCCVVLHEFTCTASRVGLYLADPSLPQTLWNTRPHRVASGQTRGPA